MRDTQHYRLGLLLVTLSAVAWSTAGLFTRLIAEDTATTLLWRGLFGAIGILAVMLAWQGPAALAAFRRLGRPGWAFALVSALGMLCFIGALRQTTVAHVAIIYATVPLVAAGLAWLALGDIASRGAMAASFTALTGVAIMVGAGREGTLGGDLLALGMTVCMAGMMVIARKYQDIPMLAAASLSAVVSAACMLPAASPLAVTGADWLLLAGFGLVNSALGLALFTIGSRMLPPVETALIGALDAPLAPIWVWLVFAETPEPSTLWGGLIVFSAVLCYLYAAAARQAAPA